MTLIIEVELDNDAFMYDDGELQRILNGIAVAAQECIGEAPVTKVRDVNGNTVGRWSIAR